MVEESVAKRLQQLLSDMINVSGREAEKFLEYFLRMRREDKELKNLEKGVGETSLVNLLKAVKSGEKLQTISVADMDYNHFSELMKKAGVKNYVGMDLSTDDRKMVLFAESDVPAVKKALEAFSAERNLLTEIEPDSFFILTEGKNLSVVNNLDDVELELIRYNSRKNPFPYTVVDIDGETNLIVKEDDLDALKDALNKTAYSLSGEQGPLVRQQVEYKLKGRQEVRIAVEEAERESVIIDKNNPKNYIAVTADDFIYYKNNKEVTSIPRTDPSAINNVYQTIEGLTEPVVITPDEFKLSEAERKVVLESKTSVYPTGYSAMDEQIEKMNNKEHNEAAKSYAQKFGIYAVDNEENSLASVLERIQERQGESNRDKADKSIDDIQY